jgi:NACHT domain-containing protein
MDPLAAKAAQVIAGKGPQAVKWTIRKARLSGLIDPTWFAMDVPGEADLELSADDIVNLRAFLSSPRVRPILAVLVTTLMAHADEDDESLQVIEAALTDEAKRWSIDSKNDWHKSLEKVWNGLVLLFASELPSLSEDDELRAEFDDFSDFADGRIRASADYRARFIALAGDVDALVRATSAADHIAAAVRDGSLPGIITHSDVDELPDFARLYVPRVLHDRQSGDEWAAEQLASAGQGFRFVLLGNPGAGKSTFVRHLSWELAQGRDGQPMQPALIVKCREYASKAWSTPLAEYIASQARVDHSVDVDREAIRDGLILGKYVVIFDGLDEITDIATRSDFCARLERFAAGHPLTSILVTSREVGYPRAPINAAKFDHLSLLEFDESQVRTYVENWFTLRQRVELIEPFITESVTVSDLRSNPLLLSLLCILYRARGAIPRRRRDIYGKCADLLFNTWDSHRQIEQPEELPAYGHRLMQEIARWVYTSTAAQNGLEQRVVEKVIATYLVSVGVTEDQARQRSHEFLEFCAGRAWLLGSFGTNDYGDKIFNFTHRTFYEYFAAEAMSRLAKSTELLGNQVMAAYRADATSVLPELLVQAYDERVDRGGAELFNFVAGNSNDAALILRLMNGSLLPANVRARGFEQVLDLWRRSPQRFDEQGFDALFSLEPNAMHQFKEDFLDAKAPGARNFFARGWASVVLDGRTHIFPTEVAEMAGVVGDRLVKDDNFLANPVVQNWLALRGDVSIGVKEIHAFLSVSTPGGEHVGAAWILLLRAAAGNLEEVTPVLQAVLHAGRYGLFQGLSVRALGAAMTNRAGRDSTAFYSDLPLDMSVKSQRDTYAALTALALALAEEGVRPGWFVPRLASVAGTVEDMEQVRRAALANDHVVVDPEVGSRASDVTKKLPQWARRWVDGEAQLVRATPELVEDLDRYIFD